MNSDIAYVKNHWKWILICCVGWPYVSNATDKTGLVAVEMVAPPAKLYHWTSMGWIWEWAIQIPKSKELPLLTNLSTKLSGIMLQKSLARYNKALFAWDHPVGGISNHTSLYPENSHPYEAATVLAKKMFNSEDPALVNKLEAEFKNLSVSGVDPGDENRVLIDLDIDPSARTLKITAEHISPWPEENYIKSSIPQLASGDTQLLYFEVGNMSEWIVLDPKIIKRFNADPRFQKSILGSALAELQSSLPRHKIHTDPSLINTDEGNKRATAILNRLMGEAEKISRALPPPFKSPSGCEHLFEYLGRMAK